jgi:hypothetical protein
MRSPVAERALRRLVARLAAAAPEDVDLVLEALDPDQRDEVRALLDAYGEPTAEAVEPPHVEVPTVQPATPEPDALLLEGLSPWVAERVASALGGANGAAGGRMTPAALDALAEAAGALPPDASPALEMATPERRRRTGPLAWMGRLLWA